MQSAHKRRWLAKAMLVAAFAVAATQLLPAWPREHQVVIDFSEAPLKVHRIGMTWTPDRADEPTGGVVLTVADPSARQLRHRLSVPGGDYVFRVSLEGTNAQSGPETTRYVRRARLDGATTTFKLGRQRK